MQHRLLWVVLATSILLNSCKQGDDLASYEQDEVLDISIDRDPDRIHPIIYPKPTARKIFSVIFLPLANFDPVTTELEPILATSIPVKRKIADRKVAYDVTIRPDAVWPNGSPITAKDYAFTFKAIAVPTVNASSYRSYTSNISDIVVDPTDEKKFSVILDEDYLLSLETVATIEIYPAYHYDPDNTLEAYSLKGLKELTIDAVAQDTALSAFSERINGRYYSQNPVGAGPYELIKYETSKYVKLKARDNYWGLAHSDIEALQQGPKEIIYHIIPDENNATTLLKEGDIDFVSGLSGATFQDLSKSEYASDKLKLETASVPKFYFLQLNTKSPELSDPLVRRALDLLVDKRTLTKALETGKEEIPNSHILATSPYYNKKLPKHQFGIKEAKNLLDEAGWTDSDGDGVRDKVINGRVTPLRLKMGATPGKLSSEIGLILKSDAAKAGVDIELIAKSYKVYKQEYMETGKFHIAAQSASQDLILYDPYSRYHSSNVNTGSNYSGYARADLDRLIMSIREGGDYDRLKPLYDQFQVIVHEDMPIIFLYIPSEKIAVNKNWDIQTSILRPGYLANNAQWQSK
jgi:peptide/nickel transport system substrate-binding protein